MKGNRYATATIICAVLSIAFALLNIFMRLGAIQIAEDAAELRAQHEARQTAQSAECWGQAPRPTGKPHGPQASPTAYTSAEEPPEPQPEPKYSVTPEERELMAQIVYLEAGAECADGQRGVAEVILNRCDNAGFPDDIREVVFAEGQFASAGYLELAKPVKEHYEAVDRALAGAAPVLEPDVVFCNTTPENDRVFAKIGGHYFCREYVW